MKDSTIWLMFIGLFLGVFILIFAFQIITDQHQDDDWDHHPCDEEGICEEDETPYNPPHDNETTTTNTGENRHDI